MSRTEKSLMFCILFLWALLVLATSFVASYLWIPSPVGETSQLTEAEFIEQGVENMLAKALGQKIFAYKEEMETEGTGGVFIPTYDLILCQREFACIHEVGHWKDKNLGLPSLTTEFRTALDTFILQCEEAEISGKDSYFCNLTRFPGINGNTLGENRWGGYSEAYAEMYVYHVLLNYPLPQAFMEFYK